MPNELNQQLNAKAQRRKENKFSILIASSRLCAFAFYRPLSKLHSLAKINLFPPIFIVSSQRPYSGRLNSTI